MNIFQVTCFVGALALLTGLILFMTLRRRDVWAFLGVVLVTLVVGIVDGLLIATIYVFILAIFPTVIGVVGLIFIFRFLGRCGWIRSVLYSIGHCAVHLTLGIVLFGHLSDYAMGIVSIVTCLVSLAVIASSIYVMIRYERREDTLEAQTGNQKDAD